MDHLSKDCLIKICTSLDKTDVLRLRTMSKKFNRIITIYVYRHYYLKFDAIILELFDFFSKHFLAPNYPEIILSGSIIDQIKSSNKLSIHRRDANKFFCNPPVCLLFANVNSIKLFEAQDDYEFLSLFKSLRKLEICTGENILGDKNMVPQLKFIESLNIKSLDIVYPVSKIVEILPNIQKLECVYLEINLLKIPQIKCLKLIRCLYIDINIVNEFRDKVDIIFDHLEKITLSSLYLFAGVNVSTINAKILMPNLKVMNILHTISENTSDMTNQIVENNLKRLKFDPDKIETLNFKCPSMENLFYQVYPPDMFKSLKY